MDPKLKELAESPFHVPGEAMKRAARLAPPKPPRESAATPAPLPGELSRAEVLERRQRALTDKQELLLDYYAETAVPVERVARHVGLYRMEEYEPEHWKPDPRSPKRPVLDVERVEAALEARRSRK